MLSLPYLKHLKKLLDKLCISYEQHAMVLRVQSAQQLSPQLPAHLRSSLPCLTHSLSGTFLAQAWMLLPSRSLLCC